MLVLALCLILTFAVLELWLIQLHIDCLQFFCERELTFTFAICYRPSVCRLSVTLVHSTQAVVIFRNICTTFCTLTIPDIHEKFYADRPRETPPSGKLNTRGVAKYSDFGLIKGYISETVQDGR